MQYNYYEFCHRVFRADAERCTGRKEYYENGKWVNDPHLELRLNDALMDYGDETITDVNDLTEEEAWKRISENK